MFLCLGCSIVYREFKLLMFKLFAVKCSGDTPIPWYNLNCEMTCIPEYGLCSATTDPHYVTFDGSHFDFKGDCAYQFFACGEVVINADHQKDKASTHTKALEVTIYTFSSKSHIYCEKCVIITTYGLN